MKYKKLVTYALIGCLVIPQSFVIYSKTANAEVMEASVAEPSTKEDGQEKKLEKLLINVKSKFEIPEDYSEFSYTYDSYGTVPEWYFNWSTVNGEKTITITCDDNGNVMRFSKYTNEETFAAATYLQSELQKKADAFLKKVVPNDYKNLQYENASYNGFYSNSYSYVYMRMKNGIPVPDQTMTVRVNASTGEVNSFNSGFDYTLTFPSSKVNLTKENATDKIKSNLKFSLEYHEVYSEERKQMEAILAYAPDKSYLAVDAHSGTVYDTRSIGDIYGKNESTETAAQDSGSAYGIKVTLSEEEIKKITELSDLITKSKALEVVKKNEALLLDSKEFTERASLSQTVLDSSKPNEKSYVWNISLTYEDKDNSQWYYVNASVDAKTGTIISFYSQPQQFYDDPKATERIKYSEEQGLEIAKTFLQSNYSGMYKKVEYTSSSESYVLTRADNDLIYGGKVYTFTRVEDGVKFIANQLRIGVDLVTGKIHSIDYTWYEDVTFEKVNDVISAEKAREAYLSFDGYDMVYEVVQDNSKDMSVATVRLVYRTDMQPFYVDPYSGKQVNYDGDEQYIKGNYSYSDIKGTTYERTILILADMGIGFDSKEFKPEQPITKEEFNQLLNQSNYYYFSNNSMSGTGTITRELAAKYAIKTLKLDYIAKLNIFDVDYKDASKIKKDNVGYVVLADELELVPARKSKTFEPTAKLTREEAANMLLQLISKYNY